MPQRSEDLENAYRHCVKIARQSGSNFFFAFYSLPKNVFREMCVLYAYMRVTDDLGDNAGLEINVRREQLKDWREKVRTAFAGQPIAEPVLQAMLDVAFRRDISLELLEEVINGVESDLNPDPFDSFSELNHYCYQVAGVVGLCCLKVWGCDFTSNRIEQQATDCGTAFQLTNILRDLGEDAQRDRLYIPIEEMQRFNLTIDEFRSTRMNKPLQDFMAFQVDRAWSFYRKAAPLQDCVSATGRPILSGFFRAYSGLLKRIEEDNYDVFSKRIRLRRREKYGILASSLLRITSAVKIPEASAPNA